jgi:hypothetical protein
MLPSKEVEDKADNRTDDDAGRDRKVKAKATSLDVNISRQITQPGDSAAK